MEFELSEMRPGLEGHGEAFIMTSEPGHPISVPPSEEPDSQATLQRRDEILAQGGRPQWVGEPVHGGLWAFIQRFDFSWFAWPVGTGITSILIDAFADVWSPYRVYLHAASIVYFTITVVLFLSIFALTATRYYKWPRLFSVMMNHPRQVAFTAMMPMTLATIVTMSSKLIESHRGGILAIWTVWWLDMTISLAVLLQVRHKLFSSQIDQGSGNVEALGVGYYLPVTALFVGVAARSDILAKLDGSEALMTILYSYFVLALSTAYMFMPAILFALRL
ncbi:voltage-dependent anion channel-domain-containing protein [Xylaria sp. FL1777]|nr:voltage-dependent anion channel-domain-containing protein [Xylaria sp. FL1777]